MALLEGGELFLILLDRRLELLDVLCAALSERCLRLSVTLLALLRSSVDLQTMSTDVISELTRAETYRLSAALAFGRLLRLFLRRLRLLFGLGRRLDRAGRSILSGIALRLDLCRDSH